MDRKIHVIDASGRPLGRLASEVALLLVGKNKSDYAFARDGGDFVHIQNASRLKFSGKKRDQKVYKWYTGYQGGLKQKKVKEVMAFDPAEVLRRAVKNMLPKNTFQTSRLKRMRVTG